MAKMGCELGDAAASASLQVLFQMIANMLVEEIKLVHGLDKEIKELEKDVKMIGATLRDNEDKELSEALKFWLAELREVAYDAIDALDEYYTENQRRTLIPFSDTRNTLGYVNPKRMYYALKISHKIKDVAARLNRISKRRHDLGLILSSSSSRGTPSNSHIESTTSLPPIVTVGREHDKQQIVGKLISQNDQGADSVVSILAVHGVCGIGKTALVQMVYNDIAISTHFELKLWVNMSQEFDFEKITRSIIESCDHGLPIVGTNLHSLQMELEKRIKGRRYLLVLDDFWHENRHDWEQLKIPLYKGAVGSRILVTTRSVPVVNMVDTLGHYHLRGLSEDECYSLVHQYASSRDNDSSNDLYGISREILNKCRGIPMEAISLGNRLHRENDRDKWREIIQREEDDFSNERNNFMRSIRLTYSRLPLNLKPCFSYCSIIPKGARLEKEWLIQLWMAQGFIPPRDGREVEDIGNDYFESLEHRSFFQRAWVNHNGERHGYHISNVIHDVSRSISNEECYIFEFREHHNLNSKLVRHMSFIIKGDTSSNVQDLFQEIFRCKGLYTLIVSDGSFNYHPIKVPEDLADNLASLRTLDLSNCNVTSLPDSIGDLKHLRCLQLWNTEIKRLPNSICHLYNLLTLGLRNCNHLETLPKEMKYLRKLRHLDLHLDNDLSGKIYNSLKSMPPKIGLLVDLRVLSRFVISENDHCGISELGNLNRLHGELLISNMDLVKNPEDAIKAKLEAKQHIQKIGFIWGNNPLRKLRTNNMWFEEKVIENLMPNSRIKMLEIVGYGGVQFPFWLGSDHLSNLKTLCLSDWKKCTDLPPLGNLPLLRDLHIKGINSVRFIDCNFCGCNPACFRSLKKLTFESMSSLENWFGHKNCELPRLDELVLSDCKNLQSLNHNLPYLTKLTIDGSSRFNRKLRFPSLKYLEINSSGHWIWASSLPLLSSLVSLTLSQLPSEILPSPIPKELISLRSLEISHCSNLLEMPDDLIPSGLTHLSIKQCPKLQRLPRGIQNLTTLEDLEIEDCIRLEYLPELKNLKSLTRLEISGCHSILFLPSEGFSSSLNFLSISDCPLFSEQFKDVRSLDRPKIVNIFSVWIDGINMSSSNTYQGENSRS